MTYTDPNYPNHRYSYVEPYRERPFSAHTNHIPHNISVKVEDVDSPDLLPVTHHPGAHSQYATTHHHPQSQQQTTQPTSSLYRFGGSPNSSALPSPSPSTPVSPFTFMSGQTWPSSSSSHSGSVSGSSFTHTAHQHQQQQYPPTRLHGYPPLQTSQDSYAHHSGHVLPSLHDDYDDGEDDGLTELPQGVALGGYGSAGLGESTNVMSGSMKGNEKQIRRRSSKACDQCRKSKCKCERVSHQEPCKNCVLLGTPCTFLGPSRKRGPPKGYIDAIEARLHQTEALIGILLASKDSRAKTLLEDLSQDSLAKDIIERVNNSPYGHKGRKRGAPPPARTRPSPTESKDGEALPPQSTHPSSEWQDMLTAKLNACAVQRNTAFEGESFGEAESKDSSAPSTSYPVSDEEGAQRRSSVASVTLHTASGDAPASTAAALSNANALSAPTSRDEDDQQARRQRRRVEGSSAAVSHAGSPAATSVSGRSQSPHYPCPPPHPALLNKRSETSLRARASQSMSPATGEDPHDETEEDDGSGEDEMALAVGQLSINEDEQVRYHGKASGLHLLGASERHDGRSEGGIWRFPKARVWPPLPPTQLTPTKTEEDWLPRLPPQDMQEHLLELYFTYVHTQLPIIHKKTFMELYRNGNVAGAGLSANSPMSEASSPSGSQASIARPQRIPILLLLAMFSIAARYSSSGAPPPEPDQMWTAGDSYMEDAKSIMDSTYAQSRPSTCQALLLLGYREVGIGAMAQAWLYIGMAVRMAQDLGLHKTADKWMNIGRTLFTPAELQERRRIWYGCVIMDKYISTYIGRPVTIRETDFDTGLPSVDEPDELEPWVPHPSPVFLDDASEKHPPVTTPVIPYTISCFNESAKLSIILSMIIQSIYPIRPHTYKHEEFARIEQLLDKWYIELLEHLRFDPSSPKYLAQPPHILTLHMQYWTTVLLLHRPFIRPLDRVSANGRLSPSSRELEIRASSRKHYDLSVQAANHITSIINVYSENHCPRRAAPFLCYYVFTAAIMHISTLSTYPGDPQARYNLQKCMDILERMHRVWPSAFRANELLHGSKVLQQNIATLMPSPRDRQKRVADVLKEGTNMQPPHQTNVANGTDNQTYRPLYSEQAGSTNQAQTQNEQRDFIDISMSPVDTPSYYPPQYNRWTPSDNTLPNMPSSLSTSGLPQQYSTGLVDERIQRNPDRAPSHRYPQYWSDYSALGQMDSAYSIPVMGDIVPQPQHTPTQQQGDQSMYVSDQYSLFNNLPSSNQQ